MVYFRETSAQHFHTLSGIYSRIGNLPEPAIISPISTIAYQHSLVSHLGTSKDTLISSQDLKNKSYYHKQSIFPEFVCQQINETAISGQMFRNTVIHEYLLRYDVNKTIVTIPFFEITLNVLKLSSLLLFLLVLLVFFSGF